jgi:hypothetical protein
LPKKTKLINTAILWVIEETVYLWTTKRCTWFWIYISKLTQSVQKHSIRNFYCCPFTNNLKNILNQFPDQTWFQAYEFFPLTFLQQIYWSLNIVYFLQCQLRLWRALFFFFETFYFTVKLHMEHDSTKQYIKKKKKTMLNKKWLSTTEHRHH